MVKKLKKRVTIEIKEDNVPEKYMTQRDENIQDEHQTNIKENEISKCTGMKDLEPVEDSLHVEINQVVKENVKQEEQVSITIQSEDEENSLFDEARVDIKHDVQKQSEEGVMS